jgi:glycosyltransferase involved in cell wall biosynthesis
VGDGAPDVVGEALASIGDPRIRYFNAAVRGPYPALPEHAWMVVGTPPYNRAMAEAGGRWLAPLDDDDTFTPDHIELLLSAARERRLELVYGLLRCRYPDGTEDFIGEFPPRTEFTELRASFGLQAALVHGGLRFMQMHLTDPLFGLNNDVSLSRRMIRAGVDMGMIDEVVADYYPARVWEPEHPAPINKSAAPSA